MAIRNKRRQRHGSAWFWKQTGCWYYTPHGTKKRQPLLDENGKRIRGTDNKQAAKLALARVRLKRGLKPVVEPSTEPAESWTVARVCSEYIAHCRSAAAAGNMHPEYAKAVAYYLNEFCRYCGALAVAELKRGYVSGWVESRPAWRSPVTRRNVIAIVVAAFNYCTDEFQVGHALGGLKRPAARPRLLSIAPEDEQAIYDAAAKPFREFLFMAIHTGLRPFCELAKLTADHVEEAGPGMMWKVYSSKTKKTRKIPVRPEVAKLTRKLMATAPPGSGMLLLRNAQGKPWKKPTAVGKFLELKRSLGWDGDDPRSRYSCYACRHTFAHRMLAGVWNGGVGCSIEVLAELMGNTPAVCFAHYGREWARHYQEPLWAAIGEGRPLKNH